MPEVPETKDRLHLEKIMPAVKPKFTMNPMALVFFILVIVLGVTDLGFVVFGGTGESLSSWLVGQTYSPYVPTLSIFIFSLGCICGHLVFGMKPELPPKPPV